VGGWGREGEEEQGRQWRLVGLTMFQAPYKDEVIHAKFLRSQYMLTKAKFLKKKKSQKSVSIDFAVSVYSLCTNEAPY
jgi:hypothetical protein